MSKHSICHISYQNNRTYILQPYLDLYKEWHDTLLDHEFSKCVKNSLQMNDIHPFDLRYVNTNVFLTYLLSLKQKDVCYFSFSCYVGKRSAFMHLISQSGNELDDDKTLAISKMMKGLKKSIVK